MRRSIFYWPEALRQPHRSELSVQNVDQQNVDQVLKLLDDAAIVNRTHLADRQRPVSIPFEQTFYN